MTARAYTAEGFDAHGNSLGDVTGATDFTVSAGASCVLKSCGSNTVGTYTVTGTDGPLTDTATLHVIAGPLASIVVSPDPATITAGDSQAYTAEGFDAHGNSLGDVTGATSFSIDGSGTCLLKSCGSNTVGTYTVTGTDGLLTDTATLHVIAGPLASIVVSPDPATITAGDSQAYTAEGFDAHGNSLGDVTGATDLHVIDGLNTCLLKSCGSNTVGTYTVTGTDGLLTDTATLHVIAGPLASIVVSPDPATITAGDSQAYTAEGFDAHGNSLGDVTGATDFTVSAGASCVLKSCGSTPWAPIRSPAPTAS